jgi:hypothetical protein
MMAHMKKKRRNSAPMPSNAETKVEDDEYVTSNCASTMLDQGEDNEEETQLTCDVLCALGSSSPQLPCDMRSDSPVSMEWPSESQRKGSKTCPKQLQLPMFLSSKLDKADHSCQASIIRSSPWSLDLLGMAKGFRFAVAGIRNSLLCPAIYYIIACR